VVLLIRTLADPQPGVLAASYAARRRGPGKWSPARGMLVHPIGCG